MAIKVFAVALFATTVFSVAYGKKVVEVNFCADNCAEPCTTKQFSGDICLNNKEYWWRYTGNADCTGETTLDFSLYNSEEACKKGGEGVTFENKSLKTGCVGQDYIQGSCLENDRISYTYCRGTDECTCNKNNFAAQNECVENRFKLSCESGKMHFQNGCLSTISAKKEEASSCTATSHYMTTSMCGVDGAGEVGISACSDSACGKSSCGEETKFKTKTCVEYKSKFWYLSSCVEENGKYAFRVYSSKEDCERHNPIAVKLSDVCSPSSATAVCVTATESSTTTSATTESTTATESTSDSGSDSPDNTSDNSSSGNNNTLFSASSTNFCIASVVFLVLATLMYTL